MSTLQPSLTQKETAWISKSVLSLMNAEADAQSPRETGGILLGYWAHDPAVPVITGAIGPGPHAVHETHRFIPDYKFHEQEIARRYLQSKGALEYLGDWHTHPGHTGDLSKRDYSTLVRIAYSRSARVQQPLMLILAHGPRWQPIVWRARKRERWFRCRSCNVDQMSVSIFNPP